jgi:putative transposase
MFYKWKAKYGGLDVSEAQWLKALEDENAKLKKLLTEALPDNAMLKDIAAKNGDARLQTGGRGAPVSEPWGEPTADVPCDRSGRDLGPLPLHQAG